MKIINIDINDNIEFKNIKDTKTGAIDFLNSSLSLPADNYNNILLNFNFISPDATEDGLHLFAIFSASHIDKPIMVEITDMEVDGEYYKTACPIPVETLEKIGNVTLGIYGYVLNDDESLSKRVSLTPTIYTVNIGSYKEDAVEGIIPTPTAFEVHFDNVEKTNAQMEANLKQYENYIQELFDNANQALKKFKHFNSVEEMKADDTLVDGYVVKTLGYSCKGDGAGGTYLIRTKLEEDNEDNRHIIFTNNDLVAELIRNNEMIGEITCEEYNDNDTDTKYWITYIPHKDKYGNVLRLKLGLADDSMEQTGHLETAREFAHRHKATVCINAGIADNASNEMTGQKLGLRMKDGQFISNVPFSYWQIHWALGITEDNTLVTFGTTQTEEQARELGCVDVTSAMTPILLNGISQKFNIQYTNSWFTATETTDETPDASKTYYTKNDTAPYYTEHTNLSAFTSGVTYYEIEDYLYQKQMIGQNTKTKDIYIFTCNGKGVGKDKGMATDKIIEIFKSLGCDFAYQLDGGGSVALVYHGEMLNNPTDNEGKTERPCADFLYVSYEDQSPYSDELNDINKRISDIKRRTQLLETLYLEARDAIPSNTDLNNITKTGNYYCLNRSVAETLKNTPNLEDFPGYSGYALYGFKLTVEKINPNVLMQTIICEGGGSSLGRSYTFVRQYSHDGTSYVWREWKLLEFSETSKITPTYIDGITINNGVFYCKNKRVCLNFEARYSFEAGVGVTVMTLPSEFKPKKYVIVPGVTNSNNTYDIAQVQVTTAGEVKVYCNVNSSVARANIVFDLES